MFLILPPNAFLNIILVTVHRLYLSVTCFQPFFSKKQRMLPLSHKFVLTHPRPVSRPDPGLRPGRSSTMGLQMRVLAGDAELANGFDVGKGVGRIESRHKMSEENEKFLSSIDEMLNMAKDWTSLDLIWDMICFQFKEIDSGKMIAIVKDLAEAGVIESRSV